MSHYSDPHRNLALSCMFTGKVCPLQSPVRVGVMIIPVMMSIFRSPDFFTYGISNRWFRSSRTHSRVKSPMHQKQQAEGVYLPIPFPQGLNHQMDHQYELPSILDLPLTRSMALVGLSDLSSSYFSHM